MSTLGPPEFIFIRHDENSRENSKYDGSDLFKDGIHIIVYCISTRGSKGVFKSSFLIPMEI